MIADKVIQNLQELEQLDEKNVEHRNIEKIITTNNFTTVPRISFVRRMAPFHGNYSTAPLIQTVIRPFLILANPAVWWAGITIAFPVLWVVGLSLVVAQIFSVPPYSLTSTQIGYMSAGPVVLASIANFICAIISEKELR